MTQPNQPAIEVSKLRKDYRTYRRESQVQSRRSRWIRERVTTTAVSDISFSLVPGDLVGFLGPNGAGKTTTLKMLAGILSPTSGQAKVLGITPWERQREYLRRIAMVMGQKNQLWWDLPARETFLVNRALYGIAPKAWTESVQKLSALLQVEDQLETPVRNLSLGERMKCELIAALLHNPEVIFLDEPTIGLDVVSQQAIREFIRDYNQENQATILLTSHYMEDVAALCQRVIILGQGQIVYDGSLAALMQQYTDTKVLKLTFREPVAEADLKGFGRLVEYAPLRTVLEVPRSEHQAVASAVLARLPVDDLLIDELALETVISKIFQAKNG